MSAMGVKIDQFAVPVCNAFKAKVVNDQLCYEVDLNDFSIENNVDKMLESGFAFIMDYNEDRQVRFYSDNNKDANEGLVNWISASDNDEKAFIYLNTIGK